MSVSEEKKYIVSDETCLGCKYYCRNPLKMCDYTYVTGKSKPKPIKPCIECEVRDIGEHIVLRLYRDMQNCIIQDSMERRKQKQIKERNRKENAGKKV